MTDTSYSPGFAPYNHWSVRQAPVPASVHNLPSSVPGAGQVQSSLIVTEGFSLISAGVTASQAGVMSIQRYLDASGLVPQGMALQTTLVANVPANLDVLDGKPFASFALTISNSSGSLSNLTNFALLLQASSASLSGAGVAQSVSWSGQTVGVTSLPSLPAGSNAIGSVSISNLPATQAISAAALPLPTGAAQDGVDGSGIAAPTGASGIRGWLSGIYQKLSGTLTISGAVTGSFYQATQPVSGSVTIGSSGTDGSTTITTGGTAQTLFGGATPSNGFAVYNPDPSNDLWVSDSATAVANGQGCIRVVANGGGYETPIGYKPIGAISIVGATTGQKITARRW